ncbi:MAG TPA: DMT family transporter [Verrucomicrobiae bacterium]|nr:DMT family transporter [Verrucomicrobiae bacterium]
MSFGIGEAFSLACALAWAIAVILFKKSGESLAPAPLNLFKNVLGLVLMLATVLAFSGASWPAIPAEVVLLAFLSGFLGIGAGDTLYFRALNAVGASRMAVAQTLYSPFVIGLSAIYLAERLGLVQFAGVALVLAGIFLVNYSPGATGVDLRAIRKGLIEATVAVALMAVGVVMAKPLLERYDFLWIVTLRIVGGTLGLMLFMAARGELRTVDVAFRGVRHWPAVIAGSVLGSYISMMLWLAGYKYTQASIAAVLNEMAAVFMLALAAVFLHDRLRPLQLLGSAVAVCGVVLVVLPG